MKTKKLLTMLLLLCLIASIVVSCGSRDNTLNSNNDNQDHQSNNDNQDHQSSNDNQDHQSNKGEYNEPDKGIVSNVADSVSWISQRQIWHQDDEGRYVLVFCLLNNDEEEVAAPATVEIEIKNNSGDIVYSATKSITTSNYSTWYYNNGAVKKYQATIYIYDYEIAKGNADVGEIHFNVYNTGHFSFDTSTLNINQLPVKPITILLPTLPTVINDYSYNGRIDSSVKITEITYEVSDDDLYIYFTGEKTYDAEGTKYSQSCKVGWKLYDSDEYIVDSGTFYSPNIAVGEKFKNEKEYAWDVIQPGETYTLVISNVD